MHHHQQQQQQQPGELLNKKFPNQPASPFAATVPNDLAASTNYTNLQQHNLDIHNADPSNHPNAGRFTEEWDASQRGSSIIDGLVDKMQRSASTASYAVGDDQQLPLRNNTLKKKGSVRRSSSRRSTRAGSVKSLALHSASEPDDTRSAFYCPVPTSGSPTEVLVDRFQIWRKVLKDLISYFREIQSHYESRSKAMIKLANVSNNIQTPASFLKSAGIDDALQFLRNHHKTAIQEANKSRDIEEDVILALTGLRSDLQQKIKEIKHLSGDFKNSVDKEMDQTSKAVRNLRDVLDKNEADSANTTGKQDPYLLRLTVDRQVERQIDEENYLHQAYLNLEGSGRELESIVIGEIQKAYNAFAGILKREADNNYSVIEELREGPISMPKDQEWIHFVTHDDRVVDPTMPLRSADQIHYPGQDHVAVQEIRAGLLERKSKYLKSYTAGWYVLSATHLHEFKSADKGQAPVMSLYLPEQKLGSHSTGEGSSNKFILKGRQTGTMHRGHTWVFRAESHDTMMAWYEDIKALTEKSPEERTQFVRTHSRSLSRSSRRSVASSDGIVDDDDEEPFSANQADVNPSPRPELVSRRYQPGGSFPSDIQVNAQRGLQAPNSPSSLGSGRQDQSAIPEAAAAAGALPVAAAAAGGSRLDEESHMGYGGTDQTPMEDMPSQAALASQQAQHDGVNPYTGEPVDQNSPNNREGGYFVTPFIAQQQRDQESQQQDFNQADTDAKDEKVRREEPEVVELNGETYTNGAEGSMNVDVQTVAAEEVPVAAAATIPPSDDKHSQALPAVPETEAAAHTTVETPLSTEEVKSKRPDDHRTDSVATISQLDIPGRFPKGGVVSP